MKTRIIAITILAATTAIFAQPRFDWDEVSGPQNRFQRQQQGYDQGQYQQRRDFREQNERPFSQRQQFQGRRAPFARQAMRERFYGSQNRNMMPQQNAPYAFNGRQGFAPQQYGMDKMRAMQGRNFAYPQDRQFQYEQGREFGRNFESRQQNYQQTPYAFRGQRQFNGPQNNDMSNRRFAYPNAESFKEQMRERNFDRERFDAPKGMRDNDRQEAHNRGPEAQNRRGDMDKQCDKGVCPKGEMNAPKAFNAPKGMRDNDQPQAHHRGLEAQGRRGDMDKQCDKGICPKEQMNAPKGEMRAPKAQMAPKAEQARKHPKEQAGNQTQASPQQVAELKLKLRNAIIEKDYKAAGKILEHLEDIDQ